MIIVKIETNQLKRDYSFSNNPYLAEGILQQGRLSNRHIWRPPTDVYECERQIVVRVEIAGMNEEDFSITLHHNLLIIQGIRNETAERTAFHQMEVRFGEFFSTVELPGPVDIESSYAEYQNGFLQVHLRKTTPTTLEIGRQDL